MGSFKDLSGKRFGRLTVIKRSEDYISPKGYVAVNWECECDCGNVVTVRGCNLKSGASLSCGCVRKDFPNRTTHGMSKTHLYSVWKGVKHRCFNERDKYYDRYGGRGITMCDEWKDSFENFKSWSMENGYKEGLSIDRVDNDAGYYPENCRWASPVMQQNNKSNNHIITHDGKTMTMTQWAREVGMNPHKLKDRINKCGWSIEKSLNTP